jgi:uncharacterized membrane protein
MGGPSPPRNIQIAVKPLIALLFVFALSPAVAQHHSHPAGSRPMPPPERRMGSEERDRLREQVRSGQMTREEARQRWHEQRAADPNRRSPEQREQLRRDVQDANRDLERR